MRAGAPLVPGTSDPVSGAGRGRRVRRRSTACRSRSRRRSAAAAAGSRSPASDEGDPGAVRVGRARGGGRVRPRRVLRRALPGQAPPRRGPGAGRHARQRDRRRHPRLLAAAPVPEARRGGARAVPHRRAARHDPRGRQGDLPGGRLPRRGHGRVPRRPGRADLVPRGQHPAAGGAPGLGGDLGHRPGARAVPHRRRRAAAVHRGPDAARALHRVPDQRRGRRPRTSCPRRARSPRSRCRRGPACGSTPASRRAR